MSAKWIGIALLILGATPAFGCLADRALFDQGYYISRAAQSLLNEESAQLKALENLPDYINAMVTHEQALIQLAMAERRLFSSVQAIFAQPDDAFVLLKDTLQTLDGGGRQSATGCLRLNASSQESISRDAVARMIQTLTNKPESIHPSGGAGKSNALSADIFLAYLAADQQAEAAAVQRLQAEQAILVLLTPEKSLGFNLIERTIGLDLLRQTAPTCFNSQTNNASFRNFTKALAELVPRPVPYDSRNVGFVAACVLQAPNPSILLNLGQIEQQLAAAALAKHNPDAFRFQQLKGRYAVLYLHMNALEAQEKGLSQRLQRYETSPNDSPESLLTARRTLQATQRHRQQSLQTLQQIESLLQQYAKSDNVQRWQRIRQQQATLKNTLKATGFDSLKATLPLNPARRLTMLYEFQRKNNITVVSQNQQYPENQRTLAYLDGMQAFSSLMLQRWQTLQQAVSKNPRQFLDTSYATLHCAIKKYVSEQLRKVNSQCLSPLQKDNLAAMETLLK